jgi:hypothetical protein
MSHFVRIFATSRLSMNFKHDYRYEYFLMLVPDWDKILHALRQIAISQTDPYPLTYGRALPFNTVRSAPVTLAFGGNVRIGR